LSAGISNSANAAGLLGSLGGIVSGVGGIISSKQQEQQGNYNATLYEQQAQATRTSQSLLETQKRRIIKSQLSSQVAQAAKSGFRYTGSPIDIALDSLANAELDIKIDRYNSSIQAQGYESQASMTRWEAKQNAAATQVKAGQAFLSTAANLFQSQKEIGLGGSKK